MTRAATPADPSPPPPSLEAEGAERPGGASPASGPNVGDRAARGFAWTLAQNVLEKGIQSAGQLALTWLLLKEDFKLVTLTYTVTTFATLLQQFGLRQVLVQRHAEFDRWATPAFWMSFSLGLAAGIVTLLAAPVAASFYSETALAGLLMVASLTLPISSLALVPEARLSAQMRFRFFAKLGVICTVCTFALSVALALLIPAPHKAYAIILPAPIVALFRVCVVWWWTGLRVRLRPALALWPHLIGDSATMLLCSLAMMVTYQGHYSVLGRMESQSDILGAFYLAYSLSDQATRTLMINLSNVLFPALSSLHHDPARQSRGFLKAIRGLMLAGLPLCFLQAIVAGPVFRVFLPETWQVAIGLFLIFSIAMLGRLILGPCESMLLAQRRQRTWLAISASYAAGFLLLTIAGTRLGQVYGASISQSLHVTFGAAEGCAVGVAVALNLIAPIAMRCCIHPGGGTWADVWRDYRFPVLGSAAAATLGWLAARPLPHSRPGDLGAMAVSTLVMGIAYAGLVWAFARTDAADLLLRMRGLAPRRLVALAEQRIKRLNVPPPEAE